MATISTCLIVKNESNCIEKCLNSILPVSDEIIIYDTGSDDGTQDICRKYPKTTVIQGEWRNDFAWARNESFKYATQQYVFWVDADDYIDDESIEWLKKFKEGELTKYDQVNLEYIYDMNENGEFTLHFLRERLFRRLSEPKWYGRIHEYPAMTIIPQEPKVTSIPFENFRITHRKHSPNPYRNLEIYRDMEKNGEVVSGRDWFYYGRECMWCTSKDEALEKFSRALNCPDLWYVDKLNLYMNTAGIYRMDRRTDKALENALLAASCTRSPRADACCFIGDIYCEKENYSVARHWYEMAIESNLDSLEETFMEKDRKDIYPYLQLCLSYYRMGDIEKSKKYNDLALAVDPLNESAKYNDNFFSTL